MEFARIFSEIIDSIFSEIIDNIRTDYRLCNGALRATAAERKSTIIHNNSDPFLYFIAKFEASLRALTETCNQTAQRISYINQQIRASDTTNNVTVDSGYDSDAAPLSVELIQCIDTQHLIDDGYIGADYRDYINALKDVWMAYEVAGWRCTEATDLAVEKFNQRHEIIVSVVEKGEKDAVREMYRRSLRPTVEMLPVEYFLEHVADPPLSADADVMRADEVGGAPVKGELNGAD